MICPACRSASTGLVRILPARDAALHFVRPWVNEDGHDRLRGEIERLWSSDHAEQRRCRTCTLRFWTPFVAGSDDYYSLAIRESNHSYPADRWEYELSARATLPSLRSGGTLLEIGAGHGAFLRKLTDEGVSVGALAGTELTGHGQAALRAMAVNVYAEDFRDVQDSFDNVVLHQVFEHLDDLDAVFAAFDRLVRPGGLVAISVPNGPHTEEIEARGGLLDEPPYHLATWNPQALGAAAEARGWCVRHSETLPPRRLLGAKVVASSRAVQARQRRRSAAALVERHITNGQLRYLAMAGTAALRLPYGLVRPSSGSEVLFAVLGR